MRWELVCIAVLVVAAWAALGGAVLVELGRAVAP
jgi:hypothetical protein